MGATRVGLATCLAEDDPHRVNGPGAETVVPRPLPGVRIDAGVLHARLPAPSWSLARLHA
ncbi:hypothetical protein C1I98_30205 [Spongiactinospora gelatinilytica]|uniref:Uncharacterized protein n=1 Tax=Spongiactinospora gelatinilytica TaxID=2666298 RepID=A0A2W2F5Z8_9ACTN|nr:hypothetical protein [Spongiactinospora gelatinilytica]PZG31342.1 hypothetical protein C1I98_30205 [Spongiactinospora gelatinilytica]